MDEEPNKHIRVARAVLSEATERTLLTDTIAGLLEEIEAVRVIAKVNQEQRDALYAERGVSQPVSVKTGDGQGEGLELRDCPFCGSTPVEGGNYIECENCGAQFIDSDDVLPAGELMARWNRRTVAS